MYYKLPYTEERDRNDKTPVINKKTKMKGRNTVSLARFFTKKSISDSHLSFQTTELITVPGYGTLV